MLANISTILYPTMLGPDDHNVLGYVASLAQRYEAQVILLHVLEPRSKHAMSLIDHMRPQGDVEALRRAGIAKLREQIHARMERFCQQEFPVDQQGQGCIPEIRITEGSPARAILQEAKAVQADVIVMGTHGRAGLGEMLLGSVAHKVIHNATVPVFLVPLRESQE